MVDSVRIERQVILTLIGRVNVGKSTLCNLLLRRDLASVDPRSGWTKEVTIYPLNEQLAVADTPGLDDPNPLVGDAAFDFVGESDFFLHVHNLDEGIAAPARAALARLRGSGRPTAVVLNKCDLRPAAEREARVRECVAALGAEGLAHFATSALTGEGIQALADWIDALVAARGDALAWARVCRRARPILEARLDKHVADIVLNYSLVAGGIGLFPVPFVDLPVILGLQVKLAQALGRVYGIEMKAKRLRGLVGVIAGGLIVRQTGRQLAKLIPGWGWIVSGAIAFAGTFGLGKALGLYYRDGMRTNPDELRRIYREEVEKAKVRFREDPDLRRRAEEEGKKGVPKEGGEAR